MADKQPLTGSSAEGAIAENKETPVALAPNRPRTSTSMQAEERDLTLASGRGLEVDVSAGLSLQRAGTSSIRRRGLEGEDTVPETRRRGGQFPRDLEILKLPAVA